MTWWGHIMLLMVPPDRGVFCRIFGTLTCLIKLSGGNFNSGNDLALVYMLSLSLLYTCIW